MMRAELLVKLLLVTLLLPLTVSAEPSLTYKLSKDAKELHVNGFTGLEDVMSDCAQYVADITVDDVIYDQSASDRIVGFRAKPTKTNRWLPAFKMNTDALYASLPSSERLSLHTLIRKDSSIITTYQVCGSGGYISVKDVYLKNSILK